MSDPTSEFVKIIFGNGPIVAILAAAVYYFFKRAEAADAATTQLRVDQIALLQKQADAGEARNAVLLEVDEERNKQINKLNQSLMVLAAEIKSNREETAKHVAALIKASRDTGGKYETLEAALIGRLLQIETILNEIIPSQKGKEG